MYGVYLTLVRCGSNKKYLKKIIGRSHTECVGGWTGREIAKKKGGGVKKFRKRCNAAKNGA